MKTWILIVGKSKIPAIAPIWVQSLISAVDEIMAKLNQGAFKGSKNLLCLGFISDVVDTVHPSYCTLYEKAS